MESVGFSRATEEAERRTTFAWLFLLITSVTAFSSLSLLSFAQAYPSSVVAAWTGLERDSGVVHYLESYQIMSWVVLPACWLLCTVLVSRRRNRRDEPDDPGGGTRDDFSRWALPTIGWWALSALLPTFHSAREVSTRSEDGYARLLAYASLDNPWPTVGAVVVALVLGFASLRVLRGPERWVSVTLAAWASAQAYLGLASRLLARALLAGEAAGALVRRDALLARVELFSWGLFLVSIGSLVAFVVQDASRKPPVERRRMLARWPRLACAVLLAILGAADTSRVVGTSFLAAAERLERSMVSMNPVTTRERGQGVPDAFGVLHADLSLTLIDRDRSWHFPPGVELPAVTPRARLALIVDERCTVGQLRGVLERVPAAQSVSLGWVSDLRAEAGGAALSGFGRLLTLGIREAPFLRGDEGALALLWPDAEPRDLSRFADSTPVSEIAPGAPLLVSEASVKAGPQPTPESIPAPRTGTWSLFRPLH